MAAAGARLMGFWSRIPVRQLPQQHQPGMRHDACAPGRDFKTTRPSGSVHVEVLLELGGHGPKQSTSSQFRSAF
jgi:hypothetical protein